MGDEKISEASSFKSWYSKNKGALSKKRKARYAQDKEYRDAIINHQREYREANPPPSRAGRARFKEIGGKEVEVVRIGKVAASIGRSDQTIRDWELGGIIPEPSIIGSHRYYTLKQVALLKELADLIDFMRATNRKELGAVIKVKSAEIFINWED